MRTKKFKPLFFWVYSDSLKDAKVSAKIINPNAKFTGEIQAVKGYITLSFRYGFEEVPHSKLQENYGQMAA